jgi:TRAP-type C4-dicarboxylate transport system substrate-binding protein
MSSQTSFQKGVVMKRIFAGFVGLGVALVAFSAWAQTKPLELKFADWNPPTSAVAKVHQKMLERIMEKSQGKIKITPYYGGSLLPAPEVFGGVQSGVAEMAYWVPGSFGSPEKLATLPRMPFSGITSPEMGTAVAAKFFATSPEVRAEYRGLEVMGFRMMPMFWMHSVHKAVRVPADVKGMKVIANAGWADYAKLLGAAPISTGIGDWYLSLERGLAEAQWAHFPAVYVFKTIDLFKYHTMIGAGSVPDCIIINKSTWDGLSPDLKKIIKDAVEVEVGEMMKADAMEEEKGIEYAKKRGNSIYYCNQDELKIWSDSAKPLHESWVDRLEKEGLPAKRVFDRWMQLVKEYKK